MKAKFRKHTVKVDGVATTYQVYEPSASGPLPLLLFLHGAGESGNDGIRPVKVGVGPAIDSDPQRFPLVAVFPQASRGYGWRGFNLAAAVAALDDAEKHYKTDRGRVYVTGISMGGYGTWLLALQQPDRFAAAVPVCGGLDQQTALRMGLLDATNRRSPHAQAAARLATLPQWVFHGEADDIIPVEESRAMVFALRGAGANVRYTEYAGVRHNSWDRAYAEPELVTWLFAQRR